MRRYGYKVAGYLSGKRWFGFHHDDDDDDDGSFAVYGVKREVDVQVKVLELEMFQTLGKVLFTVLWKI